MDIRAFIALQFGNKDFGIGSKDRDSSNHIANLETLVLFLSSLRVLGH